MNKHPRSIVRGGAGRFEHAKYSEARNPKEPRGSDMGTVWQDVRYALRNLKNAPGFALVAVLTLALGIGSSTAIFSVLDNVLMEPFPYPDAQRFMTMQIHDAARTEEGGRGAFKGPEYLDYVEQNHSFDRVIANDPVDVLYRSSEGTQLMRGNFVTPGTFEFLGMPALLGRALQPADYEAGAPPVFVLRYKTWANQFGGDAKILNQAFVLNGAARTLVGVMPPRFAWGNADLWIPEKPSRSVAEKAYSGSFPPFWSLLGHLKPGVSEEQAEADLSVVAQRLATAYPKDYPKHFTVEVLSLAGSVVGKFSRTLYLVLTAVALCVPVIFAICLGLSGQVALSAALAVLLTLICFFATAIAGYLTGIVGASNNPVSGVTVIVLLAVALFLKLVGVSQSVGPQLAILSGAIVCTAAAMAGDSTHDLATGFHVGATPRSLEIGVLVGAIASAFVMAPVLNLLIAGYGIAGTVTARAGALAAPQAFLMAKVTQGVFHGGLPLGTIAAGAALATILGISDRYLEKSGSKWRTPIMPAAIGLYLPFGLSVAIFVGALAHSIFGSQDEAESGPGILLAAGLVAGEALMGVASGAMVTAGIKLPIF